MERERQPGPDIDHPVVQMARRVSRSGQEVGSKEQIVIDEAGAKALEACLLEHADDPTLPSGVLALFGLATALHEDYGSTGAAAAIFAVLGEVGPRLSA